MMHDMGIESLQPEDVQRMDRLLGSFVRESGVRCAVLVDRAGRLLTTAGETQGLDGVSFASLAAADFSASGELAALLGEEEFTALYHHGAERSMYLTTVGGPAILAALFDKATTLGMIRLQVREIADAFASIFMDLSSRGPATLAGIDANWADEAAGELDRLFAD
jgi:predicted regulator of Ras-like GTPase activity (Roadblock/LC7/MglB family)